MPGLGQRLLEMFVALYTLRMVWNHGHRRESAAILIAAVALELFFSYPRSRH